MSISEPTAEELRELFFIFAADKPGTDRMPRIPPIRLSNRQIEGFVNSIGHITEAGQRATVRKGLIDAAEYFCSEYFLQNLPSPSATERKFKSIQAAARDLMQALELLDDAPDSKHCGIRSYLHIAAGEYGRRMGRPSGLSDHEIPWNFWTAYKLPSVITGVRLIEHWAGIARENLRRTIAENKAAKRSGNRGNSAVRVLIHRLALAWLHARGRPPGAGFDPYESAADGPFIRFADDYMRAMRKSLTDAHRMHCDDIDKALSGTRHAIRSHVRVFKGKLAKNKVKSKHGKR